MIPPAMFASFSATKALAHVLRLPGSNVLPCPGIIPETFALGYKDLYKRKMEDGCFRSNKKNAITDSIDNIQERTPGAMLAASARSSAMSTVNTNVRLAACASANKRSVLV
jgi:hypothetical protein